MRRWSSSFHRFLKSSCAFVGHFPLGAEHTFHVSVSLYPTSLYLLQNRRLLLHPRIISEPMRVDGLGISQNDSARSEIEVEQKFGLSSNSDVTSVESKLKSMGFQPSSECNHFTDWYFDLPGPDWVLTKQDYWLRLRISENASAWQLKRGSNSGQGVDTTTVYEEIEGDEAVNIAMSKILEVKKEKSLSVNEDEEKYFDGFEIPKIPNCDGSGLVPFARIETTRSTWSFGDINDEAIGTSDFRGLTVDLDGTDFGHMVGEVEAIVHNESEIYTAKQRIRNLISKLDPRSDQKSSPIYGKLETYLIKNRKDHYDACIEVGSLKK